VQAVAEAVAVVKQELLKAEAEVVVLAVATG
jgi:hypothetical protein